MAVAMVTAMAAAAAMAIRPQSPIACAFTGSHQAAKWAIAIFRFGSHSDTDMRGRFRAQFLSQKSAGPG